ncbi:MAG: hypothetical protein Fur0032_20120 [Terrimicrobiaceae bacterium]
MNRLVPFLVLGCGLAALWAHDHIEVGEDPDEEGKIELFGPLAQVALWVPRGATFSNYAQLFPGGFFSNELTFTTDNLVLDSLPPFSDPRIEFLSVTGPVGGEIGFWEPDATSPTLSLLTGWTFSGGNAPGFAVELGGDGHVHGRLFTFTLPGTYTISMRAVSEANPSLTPSDPITTTFQALEPPRLEIQTDGLNVTLSFLSRDLYSYEIQRSTTLEPDDWEYVVTLEGSGSMLSHSEPLGSRKRVFYRLVEFR